jgi:hypothetical protein
MGHLDFPAKRCPWLTPLLVYFVKSFPTRLETICLAMGYLHQWIPQLVHQWIIIYLWITLMPSMYGSTIFKE